MNCVPKRGQNAIVSSLKGCFDVEEEKVIVIGVAESRDGAGNGDENERMFGDEEGD